VDGVGLHETEPVQRVLLLGVPADIVHEPQLHALELVLHPDIAADGHYTLEQEEHEVFVVQVACAVADPGTVVVEPQHALAAEETVVRTFWTDQLALRAP